MAIGYTQIVLLCFSALIIHWTNTATLHSSLHASTSKLLRRQNPSSARRDEAKLASAIYRSKRWTKAKDHDEIEIPTDETNVTASVSTDDGSSVESTLNTSTPSINEISDHSTGQSRIVEETLQSSNMDTNGNFSGNDSFSSSTLFNEISSSYFTTVNEEMTNETLYSQTREDVSNTSVDPSLTRVLIDFTTISYSIPSENQTDEEYPANDERVLNATNDSIVSLKDTFVSDLETDNLTQTNDLTVKTVAVMDTNENETVLINAEPIPSPPLICDEACQCWKECPYGFEMLNDTCECHPPCQNYPCFGNDTCIVSESGQPRCQPKNGTEHDRPSRCHQPRDAGFHDQSMGYHSRWYYHPDQDTCHLFVYRGLGGNDNNFRTLHECHVECITCGPSPDRGTCFGRIQMWYYEHRTRACALFEYSGCRGNENKFVQEDQCLDTCVNRVLLSH